MFRIVGRRSRIKDLCSLALNEARSAAESGEVPVGAVIYTGDGRLFLGRNRVEERQDPTAHAEMEVLRAAIEAMRGRLEGGILFTTAEPCLMCAGAMVHARISALHYGCEEPRWGCVSALRSGWKEGRLPHRFPIRAGEGAEESRQLLQTFFAQRR